MDIMLQQLDITMNQCYDPYFNNAESKYNLKYIEHLYKKIQRRCEQLDNLKLLLNEELSDEEFYQLASKVYWFSFHNKGFIKTNVVLEIKYDYLMINIRINSKHDFDINKNYTLSQIEELFRNEEVLYEGIFISEDNDINDLDNYVVCNNEEFSCYYSKFKSFKNVASSKNIIEVKRVLTKDRIRKDYDRLLKQTEIELGYLSRKYEEDKKLNL